ncbi:MAG: hypothetical protein ACI8ZM_004728 [Crocinitomix sp.]|jgi:hypothetical protein
MSNPKSLNGFQKSYCTPLIPEPNSKSFFVKVAVENYEELNLIKSNLLTAIKLIADSNEYGFSKSEISHSIGTLVKLLRNFGLEEECIGLSELIKLE